MSISDEILLFLTSGPSSYGKLQNTWRQGLRADIPKTTLYTSFQRLKNKGLVKKNNDHWELTTSGQIYISNKLPQFEDTIKQKEKILILFDIPEKERSKRKWLRKQLSIFNYKKIQGSVWLGPGPLPKGFISFLKKEGMYKYILFFRTDGNINL